MTVVCYAEGVGRCDYLGLYLFVNLLLVLERLEGGYKGFLGKLLVRWQGWFKDLTLWSLIILRLMCNSILAPILSPESLFFLVLVKVIRLVVAAIIPCIFLLIFYLIRRWCWLMRLILMMWIIRLLLLHHLLLSKFFRICRRW